MSKGSMDEARFENPKVISGGSGGFANSNGTMPSDVVSKAAPPSILDRFRAMVKEREDEVRVSEDEVVSLDTDEVVRLYELVLSELTFNSKPLITDLTIIAGEQREHGQGIADAICARILEVPVEQKLPSLYLLDSIVKNIRREYVTHFSARLPEVFCEAYRQVHSNMYPAMRHLFGTWSTVFPSSVLRKIEARLQFSPPLNNQSSSLTSLRASESPRPTHGIHVNPKYLEARRQFGHTTSDAVGAESSSSSGHGHAASARIARPSAPYQVKHGRSLSPSVDDFVVDGPTRGAEKASSSHSGFDHGFSRVSGRHEHANEWQRNVLPEDVGRRCETPAAYKYNNGVNLDRPRALIDAYGMDEREKSNHKHLKTDLLNVNGIHKNVSLKTWQNTEEEEFNWEDMSPTLADSGRSNDLFSSSIPPPANLRSRPGPGTRPGAPLAATNFRSNLSNQAQLSVLNDPYVNEDLPGISSGQGAIDRIARFHNEKPQLTGSHFIQEGFGLPKSLSQSSQHHFSVKAVGRNHQMPYPAPLPEQKPPLIGSFQNADGRIQGSSALVSKINSSGFDPLSPEMQPAGPASTATWRPPNMHSSYRPPSLPIPRAHEKIGYQPATVTPQGPNKSILPLQQLDTIENKPQIKVPQFSTQRHGRMPLNQQFPAQMNVVQPQPRPLQDQNMVPPASVSAPSHLVRPSLNHGYIPPQGHVAPAGTVALNNIRSFHSSVPTANAPFQLPGAFPLNPRGPSPVSSQILLLSQNQGPTGPNAQAGGTLSGLISTLMAQGVISLTNQASAVQDSVGLQFNQDLLKVRHESAISALYADLPRQCTTCGLRFKCQEAHSSHMDWHVTRNRILKNRKQKPSRKWFVNVGMWLSSAEALGTDAVPGFLPTENVVEDNCDEEMAVPADDDQKPCALCGEPFDDFYSDETEEWMYKGAVYMNEPSGLIAGIDRSQLGPIVHAKCRSETSGVSAEDHRRNEAGYSEEGSERKRLRS